MLIELGCLIPSDWQIRFFRDACIITLIVFTVSSVICDSNGSQFRKDAYVVLDSVALDIINRDRAIEDF